MKIIQGDILSNIDNNKITIILHGCNCFHKMNAGLAKYLRRKYPVIYKYDKETKYGDIRKLGTIIPVKINNNLFIINCYTQYKYGRDRRYLNYEALYRCLSNVKKFISKLDDSIDLRSPKIGCGLAGGDWRIVRVMFEVLLPCVVIYYRD